MDTLKNRESKALEQNLSNNEKVLSIYVGIYKQAVILTDIKILIIKGGFMTGQTFGVKVISYNYNTITSVEVKKGVMTGVFEVATGGVQGVEKSFWGNKLS